MQPCIFMWRSLPSAWRPNIAPASTLIGSPALQDRGAMPVDIRVLPLSRAENDALARHIDPRFSTARSRQTFLVPRYGQAMSRVQAADDNAVNQPVVRGLLELLGCEVEIAMGGQQAIDCRRTRPPDLGQF